jgi:hypothetical protein
MRHIIEVSFEGCAWVVKTPGQCEPSLYRTGRRAEVAARCLANRLAQDGQTAKLIIRDRRAVVVGDIKISSNHPLQRRGHPQMTAPDI